MISPVAENINFNVQSGELVALVGTNGVGKSTLLRTLSGIQPKLSGEILLHNTLLSSYKSNQLAKSLSIVLTEGIPTKNLSVLEVIALGRQPYTNWIGSLSSKDIDVVKTILNDTGLNELQDKKCYQLSDGQFQRVMIARALAQDTSLILLDEPTTHLDIYHKAYVLKMLKNIVKTTTRSIVFSTHEIGLALQLCDKIVILQKEKSIFGTPEELIKQEVFSDLFGSDLISFDPQTASFKIN
ncbi:iron-chelate-transporting ATPase [Galbibacter marinus]|uniref:Iron-chelate-transporting ATPase n=1 Tax=Galbibacter marinus TaxID=555500 RepID=K2PUV5_9FLAO|nr:ABC transporter ATP-binding protein [Galbibacter marinus]EKF56455.1 iron-chelate-transporting ATPase [Galbibacter marinus]